MRKGSTRAHLTSRDAAEYVGIHFRRLKVMAENGQIPQAYRTPGGHWRFPLAGLDELKDRQ